MVKKKIKSLPSGKKLDSEIKKAQDAYDKANKHLSDINNQINSNQKTIDKANDFLNKTNGYNAAHDAWKSAKKQLADLEAKLSKTKDKAKRTKLEREIKSKKKDVKSAYADLKKIKYSASAQKKFDAMSKAESSNKKLAKSKKAANNAKTKKKTALDKLKKKKASDKNTAKKKAQSKNKTAINNKIKKQENKFLAPQTALFRADLANSDVFFLGEISPTETDDADGPSHPVDGGDPRTNYNVRSGKTLSGTYYIVDNVGKDREARRHNLDKDFASLQKWQRLGYELCIRGFSRWGHVYIQSISKVSENHDQSGLQLNITFTYKMPANLVYRQKKSKSNSKGKTTPKTGNNSKKKGNDKKVYHTIKAGDTYWDLARHYGTTVSKLEKLNPWPARQLPMGKKMRIK